MSVFCVFANASLLADEKVASRSCPIIKLTGCLRLLAIKIRERLRKPARLGLQGRIAQALVQRVHVVVHLLEAAIARDAPLRSTKQTDTHHTQTTHLDNDAESNTALQMQLFAPLLASEVDVSRTELLGPDRVLDDGRERVKELLSVLDAHTQVPIDICTMPVSLDSKQEPISHTTPTNLHLKLARK